MVKAVRSSTVKDIWSPFFGQVGFSCWHSSDTHDVQLYPACHIPGLLKAPRDETLPKRVRLIPLTTFKTDWRIRFCSGPCRRAAAFGKLQEMIR